VTVYFTTSGAGNFAVQAGSNDIRIIGLEFVTISGSPDNGWLYLGQPGASSMTGGTVQAPFAAHQGAPASTATTRIEGCTVSGTSRLVGSYVVPSTTNGFGTVTGVTQWQPIGDLIIPSTGIFHRGGGSYQAVLWFEELRLSYGY
jgi:hypothetical protein